MHSTSILLNTPHITPIRSNFVSKKNEINGFWMMWTGEYGDRIRRMLVMFSTEQ